MTDRVHRAGYREAIALPGLTSESVVAKLDTGAEWSVADADSVRQVERDGEARVAFSLVLERSGDRPIAIESEAPLISWRRVRSSNGAIEERPVVRVVAGLGGLEFPLELTLTDRRNMSHRLLLGREALAGRFLVDSGAEFVASERPVS